MTGSMDWDLRKVSELSFYRRKKKIDFRLLAEALWRVRTWFGTDGKFSAERWYLSPYVEKPLNSKVIKSFVPELSSRKCFLFFGIPMLYIYVRYGHYERFSYRYEYVYFTYSCMAMVHVEMFLKKGWNINNNQDIDARQTTIKMLFREMVKCYPFKSTPTFALIHNKSQSKICHAWRRQKI